MRKIFLIVALMLTCLSGAALAQDDMTIPVFCGDLAEEDCAILESSTDAMKTLDSASFEFIGAMTFNNIPEMPASTIIGFNGSGAFSGATAVDMGTMSDMTDMAAMNEQSVEYFLSALDNFDLDLALTISLPPELVEEAGDNAPSSIQFEVLLVDGVGYVNLDALQPLINDPSLQGWWGIDLANLMRDLQAQMPEMFDMGGMGAMTGGFDPTMYSQFSDPEFMNQFATITRIDDGTGRNAAFETTLDFAGLMSNPDFQALMDEQMQAQMELQGMDMSEMTAEEQQQVMDMMQQMFEGMTMTMTQVVRLDDFFTETIMFNMNFDFSSMAAAMSALGDEADAEELAELQDASFSFDFTLSYADFNAAPAITAPEGAMLIPYQSLLGMDAGAMPDSDDPMMMEPTATPGESGSGDSATEPTEPSEPADDATAEVPSLPEGELTTEPPTPGEVTLEPPMDG